MDSVALGHRDMVENQTDTLFQFCFLLFLSLSLLQYGKCTINKVTKNCPRKSSLVLKMTKQSDGVGMGGGKGVLG